ncbi:MAG: DNRLRE domain-containing protein [candidate division Zixibacteria bacterium]|nr:DNRLRE domain-containing protein [candidate division Zixibacteria bacterium]
MRITMKAISLLSVLLLCCSAMANPIEEIIVYPCDDMYTDPTSGGNPEDQLWVADDGLENHYGRAMLKFDLTEYMGAQLLGATLWVYRFYGCSGGNTVAGVYEILEAWEEDTWPETEHIDHGMLAWSDHVFSTNGWHEIDVYELVQEWLNNSIPNLGLVIRGNNGTKLTKLYSCECDNSEYRPYLSLAIPETGVRDDVNLPDEFNIRIHPNPFNASSSINFTLPQNSFVNIDIYNLTGKSVLTLYEGVMQAGSHKLYWDASKAPSGVYFCRFKIGEKELTKKLSLIR